MYLEQNIKHVHKLLKEIESRTIKDRTYFHENPELSMEERNTNQYITRRMDQLGLEYSIVGDYGIIGKLDGGQGPGRTVMLRADMDALPIQESVNNLKEKKKVISKIEGVSHACGHDAHMAILLSAMEVLLGLKDSFKGRILLVFEQAEEVGGGIHQMVEALRKYEIDNCWGLHVYSELESGRISIDEGPRMAGIRGFQFTIKGQGGHVSRPDKCINPINAGVNIVNALNTVWATELEAGKTITLGISNFQAGIKQNIIPDEGIIAGSLRFFDKEAGIKAFERLEDIVISVAKIHGCEAKLTGGFSLPDPLVNEKESSRMAKDAIEDLLGKELIRSCEPWFGSESMVLYLKEIPGVFGFLGIKDEDYGSGSGHHTAEFDIDDKVLKNGVGASVAYALKALSK